MLKNHVTVPLFDCISITQLFYIHYITVLELKYNFYKSFVTILYNCSRMLQIFHGNFVTEFGNCYRTCVTEF